VKNIEKAATIRYGLDPYLWAKQKEKDGFIKGAKWQQEESQQIVPFDAYNIEVFKIEADENGGLFAYIGYRITNGNFHFSVVPFTQRQQDKNKYSEEEVLDMMFELLNQKREECCITHTRDSIVRKVFEKFKKK
jgi:hypothetical protein